ncbi:MAG: hypothetical protein JRI23_07670 [Deltaproteobacteria bacterium]|jgi:hypothetical protein|nr:hypothetical protein [Deltaproteobacteria bacterium]MBW2531483.1 hypothetical protein [Deltaproteobacteria bacterium]
MPKHVNVQIEPPSSGCSVDKVPPEHSQPAGTVVTLTAVAVSGYEFDQWQGDLSSSANPATVTLDDNRSVTAVFRPVYTLTVTAADGSVAKSPDATHYDPSEVVTLTATPAAGYLFDHWGGALSGSSNPETLTMDGSKSVTAVFVRDYIEDEDGSDESEAGELADPDAVVVQQTTGNKYLHVAVPNYDENTNSTTAPRTYLQLGAFPDSISNPRHWGDDLLDDVLVPTSATAYFKDDYRYQNNQTHPKTTYTEWDGNPKTTVTDPRTLTSRLRTRGGWRQHTDGNFISTTRGDRIDVYYGNYKMVVLGRMDITGGAWGETYWESSGGHTRWATNTQGDMVLVRWNKDRSRWRTYEETVKGDLVDRYQGIREEIYECPRIVTMVGSPDPETTAIPEVDKDPHTQQTREADSSSTGHYPPAYAGKWVRPGGRKKQRPDVTERVYAKKIKSTTTVKDSQATNDTECSDTSLTSFEVVERTDGSKGLAFGGDVDFAAQRPQRGHMLSRKSVATQASDEVFTWGGRVYETLTVDEDVSITSETGFAPADAAADKSDAVRVDHLSDLLFCFGKVSSDITAATYLKGHGAPDMVAYDGGWTFNFSLVGVAIDFSVGATLTVPRFERADAYLRTEVGLAISNITTIDFALSLDINAVLFTVKASILPMTVFKGDFTKWDDFCLLGFKVVLEDRSADLVDLDLDPVDMDTSLNASGT